MNTTPIHNYTELYNSTGLQGMFSWINTQSTGLFIPMILLAVFVITFIGLKNFLAEKAFFAAGYITSLVALMFWAAGILPTVYPIILFLVTSVTVLVIRMK